MKKKSSKATSKRKHQAAKAKPAAKHVKPAKAAKPKKPTAKLTAKLTAKPSAVPVPAKLASKRAAPVAAVVEEAPPKILTLSKTDSNLYKKLLLDLRDHLIDGVSFLASDNLKRSSRDVSGELSGYSMHMADAGTDNYDREFALSLVSSEQEGLYEIGEALKRLEQKTYGLCEMCEKAIGRERLKAVPFARNCIQCQSMMEKDRRRPMQPTAIFSEQSEDESGESDDTEES